MSEAICERDGHTYVVVEEQAATCTVSGYQVLSCSVCGDEKTEEISAEHNYVSAETKKATCAETGYELFRCTVCGAETKTVLAKTTNHSWKTITVQPDCETAGSSVECCTVCGAKQNAKTLSASGHQYKTTVKAASPGEDGAITEKCTVCGKTGTTTVIAAPKTLELSKTSYTYDKKAKLPKVTVKDANGAVISTSNYTVSYASGRKKVGTYAVTVTLTGNYSGTLTSSFKIVPKGTSIKKLKAAKKSLTITIKKQKTQTSGYEIQYSTSKNFKKSKTKTVKKNTVTKVTLKKLKKGTRYYVRIRTYKIIKGKKYYSKWSKAKKIRTKK